MRPFRWERIVGFRALKTALAAGLAWAAGSLVPGNPHPYLAPLTAVLTVQLTVAASVSSAVSRTIGVVVGVALALGAGHVIGLNAWSIGALVLLALMIGNWLRLGPQGTPQVATNALLVLIIGSLSGPGYAWSRILESVIGALVAVAVNALLAPPNYLPGVRAELGVVAAELAGVLRALASALRSGLTPAAATVALEQARTVNHRLEAARAAVERAEQSLEYNLFGRRQRTSVRRLRLAFEALEHAGIEVRGIARSVHDAQRPTVGGTHDLAPLVEATADAVEGFWLATVDDGPAGVRRWSDLAARAQGTRQGLEAGVRAADGWLLLGSILEDSERLVADLAAAVELVRGLRP